jgi:peptidoglycan/xylan/chitin deacetylase (PgdA/CDA1 family)
MKKMLVVLAAVIVFGFVFCAAAVAVQPLDKGMVVFTFDDSPISFYTNVLPVLKKYGITGTVYALTGPAYLGTTEYMSASQLWESYLYGVEIGNHSKNHLKWEKLTDAQILAEVVGCQDDLYNIGILTLGAFTPPFGDPYDDPALYSRMVTILDQAGFVTSSRVPWDDTDIFNEVGMFNAYRINSYQLMNGRKLTDIKTLINEAAAEKKLLVFTIHNVLPTGGDLDLALFNSVVQYAVSLKAKIDIVPMSKAVSKMLHYQNLP